MTHEQLEKIAIEYLNNDISIKDLSAKYKISKTTLIRYFDGEIKTARLNKDLQININKERKKRFPLKVNIFWSSWFLSSKSTKGNKEKFAISQEEIILLANYYIQNDDVNLEAISNLKKVSKATIYNSFTPHNLGEDLYNAVLEKYKLNHKNAFKR